MSGFTFAEGSKGISTAPPPLFIQLSAALPSLIHWCVCLAKHPITSSLLSIPSRMGVSKSVGMNNQEWDRNASCITTMLNWDRFKMGPRRSAHKAELSSTHATNQSLLFSGWSPEAQFREQTLWKLLVWQRLKCFETLGSLFREEDGGLRQPEKEESLESFSEEGGNLNLQHSHRSHLYKAKNLFHSCNHSVSFIHIYVKTEGKWNNSSTVRRHFS